MLSLGSASVERVVWMLRLVAITAYDSSCDKCRLQESFRVRTRLFSHLFVPHRINSLTFTP